jgi:anti-anti-sigma factor
MTMNECTISSDRTDGETVAVRLEGQVDLHAAPQLKRVLLGAVGVRSVVVDLTGVRLVDSTTLGVLLGVDRRFTEAGTTLSVVCGGQVLALMRGTGLDEILEVVPAPTRELVEAAA